MEAIATGCLSDDWARSRRDPVRHLLRTLPGAMGGTEPYFGQVRGSTLGTRSVRGGNVRSGRAIALPPAYPTSGRLGRPTAPISASGGGLSSGARHHQPIVPAAGAGPATAGTR